MSGLITLTTGEGFAFGLVLITIGFIANAALTMWAETDDEPVTSPADQDAVHDQAIALTIEPEPTEPTLMIPMQRVTNGEDLLGGGRR